MKHGAYTLLILLAISVCSFAEEHPAASSAKIIRPADDVPIRLEAADIRIVINSEAASVSGAYYLVNEGAADTVTVGFTRGNERELSDFKAFADIELDVESPSSAPFTGSDASQRPWWKVFRVPFPEGKEVVEVINLYDVPMEPAGTFKARDVSFTYDVESGGRWNGAVKDARVTVFLDDIEFDRVTDIRPETFDRDNNRIMWHMTDFEPSQKHNIVISFLPAEVYYTLTTARAMLEREPENAHAHFLIGQTFLLRACLNPGAESCMDDAEQALTKAVEHNPDHLDARFCLAILNHCKNDENAARTQLEKIIGSNPSYTCEKSRFASDIARIAPSPTAAGWLALLR